MNGSPCVMPDCAEHTRGPNQNECYTQVDSVTAPGADGPILLSTLAQVCDEDAVVISVWSGGEDTDCALEEPAEVREFAARLRAFADQLDRDADLLARLQGAIVRAVAL